MERIVLKAKSFSLPVLLVFLGALFSPLSVGKASAVANIKYAGVNLSGAEFGYNVPGTYGIDYIYPTHAEVDYFVGKGMNIIRLPFLWERLQGSQFSNFDSLELARLDDFVNYATSKGAMVILDPHNFARYYGTVIGDPSVPASAFADLWSRLASRYKNNSRVIFGLVNEPNTMSTEQWLADANAAISAIRSAGATNIIFVPGNAWSGAFTWYDNWYGTPNSTVMLGIVDSGNNYAVEVHQYLDSDGSGTSSTCISSTIGSQRLQAFTGWLRQNGKRGFLGEFAGARNATCYAALDDMLTYIDNNSDVWLGWTYWSAGPWWDEYMFTLEPKNGQDRPQMPILLTHLPAQFRISLPIISR